MRFTPSPKIKDLLLAMAIVLLIAQLFTWITSEILLKPAEDPKPQAKPQYEQKIQELEQELAELKKSHAMAIKINQDLDERLSVVEGRNTR